MKIGIVRAMHYRRVYRIFCPYFPHLLPDLGGILYDTINIRGHVKFQLVEALRYKLEVRGFD